MPARFEIFQDRSRQWRWRLRHTNGRIIADSGEGYRSRAGARRGIQSVQKIAQATRIERIEGARAQRSTRRARTRTGARVGRARPRSPEMGARRRRQVERVYSPRSRPRVT